MKRQNESDEKNSGENFVEVVRYANHFFGRLDKDLKKFGYTLDHINYLNNIDVWSMHKDLFALIKKNAMDIASKPDEFIEGMQNLLFHSNIKLNLRYEKQILSGAFTQLFILGKRLIDQENRKKQ